VRFADGRYGHVGPATLGLAAAGPAALGLAAAGPTAAGPTAVGPFCGQAHPLL